MEEFNYSSNILTEIQGGLQNNLKCKFYFYPKCKKVPSIEMIEDSKVEISCTCFQHDAHLVYEGKKMDLKSLAEFKKYTNSLDKSIG